MVAAALPIQTRSPRRKPGPRPFQRSGCSESGWTVLGPGFRRGERKWGAGIWAALLLAVTLVFAGAGHARAAPSFPPLTGRVVDNAHVLSAQTVADLTAKEEALEAKTGDQLVVVTLPSLQGYEIEDYGYQLGRAWNLGQKGKNNGVLLIVAPAEHKVRIEVGYGLEPVLTDALSNVILQEKVLPKFKAGDMEGGTVAGADAIIGQLGLDPDAAAANVKAASEQKTHARSIDPFQIIFIAFIVIFLLVRVLGGFGRRSGLLGAAASGMFWGGLGGGGFGGGSGGGGGGGFSGGGGSFGGGGSSGSW